LDINEEYIVDREGDIFDPVLSIGNISKLKNKLVGLDVENMSILNMARLSILPFYQEQSYYFPEFIN
jgi:hypothetical protein